MDINIRDRDHIPDDKPSNLFRIGDVWFIDVLKTLSRLDKHQEILKNLTLINYNDNQDEY